MRGVSSLGGAAFILFKLQNRLREVGARRNLDLRLQAQRLNGMFRASGDMDGERKFPLCQLLIHARHAKRDIVGRKENAGDLFELFENKFFLSDNCRNVGKRDFELFCFGKINQLVVGAQQGGIGSEKFCAFQTVRRNQRT